MYSQREALSGSSFSLLTQRGMPNSTAEQVSEEALFAGAGVGACAGVPRTVAVRDVSTDKLVLLLRRP